MEYWRAVSPIVYTFSAYKNSFRGDVFIENPIPIFFLLPQLFDVKSLRKGF